MATETSIQSGLSDYWVKVFKNSDIIKQSSGENKDDEKIFAYLKNVELEFDKESTRNFSVVLTFTDNEWFTNNVLKKTFIYDETDPLGEEPTRTVGTKIEWNDGKNVTEKTVEKKTKKQENWLSEKSQEAN